MRNFLLGLTLCCLSQLGLANTWQEPNKLVTQLDNYHVQVIELGQNVLIVLPASLLFPMQSPRLLPQAKQPLDLVGKFLKDQHKVDVKVAAYTDDTGITKRNMALSQRRAEKVADYLWRYGIDARVQVATGYGPLKPIATNQTTWGRAQNRRIEITFRRLDT